MDPRHAREVRAYQSFAKLLEEASGCKRLFDEAGLKLPEPLMRFLGEVDFSDHSKPMKRIVVPPPDAPPRPAEAEEDWIWVSLDAATPTTLVLAILKEAAGPLAAKEVAEAVLRRMPQTYPGAIANIGSRLAGKLIKRTGDGWSLVDADKAPTLKGDHLWGPPAVFMKQEIAAHRRNGVMHVLRLHNDGLQIMQLLSILSGCDWLHAPLSKELVQDDVELLAREGRLKRSGNSKKWRTSDANGRAER